CKSPARAGPAASPDRRCRTIAVGGSAAATGTASVCGTAGRTAGAAGLGGWPVPRWPGWVSWRRLAQRHHGGAGPAGGNALPRLAGNVASIPLAVGLADGEALAVVQTQLVASGSAQVLDIVELPGNFRLARCQGFAAGQAGM